jgi:phosphoribosylanthranilate isomerase
MEQAYAIALIMTSISTSFLIKICGLSTSATMDAALEAGADMVGLVFHRKSPRSVSREQAQVLADQARHRAQIVALVVNCEIEIAAELSRQVKPDWFQLHGSETPELAAATQRATGCRILKAIGVSVADDLAGIAAYQAMANMILLDAKPPKDAAYPGGHGKVFDWSILRQLDPAQPMMLSGGLTPENVADAITTVRALGVNLIGVDVSSGVESAPGVKDVSKIADFIQAARQAARGATA